MSKSLEKTKKAMWRHKEEYFRLKELKAQRSWGGPCLAWQRKSIEMGAGMAGARAGSVRGGSRK